MRNQVPQDLQRRVGQLSAADREVLRALVQAWYKLEQQRLTTLDKGKQLRQAQGAAQVLDDLSAVLEDPAKFTQNPVKPPRSF